MTAIAQALGRSSRPSLEKPRRTRCCLWLASALTAAACGDFGPRPEHPDVKYRAPDAEPFGDAGVPDQGSPDTGFYPDAEFPDQGPPDTGLFPDAEPPDQGPPDTGLFPDAEPPDQGPPDTGLFPDAEPPDQGPPDTGLFPDAEPPDQGPADAGAPDGGTMDSGAADAEVTDRNLIDIGPLGPGVSTLTGMGEPGDNEGPRGLARLSNPVNLVVGADGRVYVADFYNSRIARVTPDGTLRTLYQDPAFIRPFGLAFTSSTTLYIETDRDPENQLRGTIWRLSLTTTTATVVGTDLGRPRGMAALPDGRLALADDRAHVVELFDPATGALTPLAGRRGEAGYINATGDSARFNGPSDLIATSSTDLLVADTFNNRLRRVTLSGVVTTWAGTGTTASFDGPRLSAGFNGPQSLAIDRSGVIYVGDGMSPLIRRITRSGAVQTLAGVGFRGFQDDVDPLRAIFFAMEGLDVTADGTFAYIADGNGGALELPYNRIRRLQLP